MTHHLNPKHGRKKYIISTSTRANGIGMKSMDHGQKRARSRSLDGGETSSREDPVVNGVAGAEGDSDYVESLGFANFALRDLKACEEVVLGWEWDDGSVVH